jgi:hypothetical protein
MPVNGIAARTLLYLVVGGIVALVVFVGIRSTLAPGTEPPISPPVFAATFSMPAPTALPTPFPEPTTAPVSSPTAPAISEEPQPSTFTLTDDERRGQVVSEPRLAECSTFTNIVEEGTPTIELAVLWAELTILGDIREIGGARYNTPGGELTGERPVGMYDVYRPTLVHVETVVDGKPIDGDVKVRLPGGSLGCDTYEIDRTQAVDGEGLYVLFLGWEPDVRGNDVPEMTIVRAWPVNDAGMVVTPYDGELSVEEFILRANAE